jgi:1,4-alpha-glucan branching enzyme
MSIIKKFFPEKEVCRVKFKLTKTSSNNADRIAIVGDFNLWQTDKKLMKKDAKGNFTAQIDLPMNKIYQFRYLIDTYTWENDWDADGLISTPYEETYNSLINCNVGE